MATGEVGQVAQTRESGLKRGSLEAIRTQDLDGGGMNEELAIKFLEQLTRIADSLEKIKQEMDTGNFSYLADLGDIVTVLEGEK